MKSKGYSLLTKFGVFSLLIVTICTCANLYATYEKTEANKKTGFSGNSIFQNYGDENINIMNGNLLLVHPNSPSYPVNAGFSYQLNRVYNSKIWAFDENVCYPSNENYPPEPVFVAATSMGAGWTFHLGRIYFIKNYDTDSFDHISIHFQASDGAEHTLWIDDDGYYYSKDNSYIRAAVEKSNPNNPATWVWTLWLSDGTKYTFDWYVPTIFPALDFYEDSIDDNYKGWYPRRIEDI